MIHIVEDDQNVRDGFTILLKSAGFECSVFDSAEKFLEKFKAGANDLLILDMHLPGMNGCSVMEYLRIKRMRLPVIVITGFDEESTRTAAKDYGALAYLRKPVDSTALLDLIKFNFAKTNNSKN